MVGIECNFFFSLKREKLLNGFCGITVRAVCASGDSDLIDTNVISNIFVVADNLYWNNTRRIYNV